MLSEAKHKIRFFFTLTLPLSFAIAAENTQDDMTISTLKSLDAITSTVDGPPALLLLTPSELQAFAPPADTHPVKQVNKLPNKQSKEPHATLAQQELKALQTKINQLNATLNQRNAEIKRLRQATPQTANSHDDIAKLKQNLQENLRKTEKMQQELASAIAAKTENGQGSSRLQQSLSQSQQQSSVLQKQLDTLAVAQNDKTKEIQALRVELDESRKHNEDLQKLLNISTGKEQKAPTLQKQMDTLMVAQVAKDSERNILKADLAQSKLLEETAQKQLTTLTDNLAEKDQQIAAMKKQLETLTASETEKARSNASLKIALDGSNEQYENLTKQLSSLTEKVAAKEKENGDLQQQLAALQKSHVDASVTPKTANEIRDYAIGNSLANDMLTLLKEKSALGINADNLLVLAGIQDTFTGKLKLAKGKIEKALDESEAVLGNNENQLKQKSEEVGKQYLEQFKKQKQVKQDPSGYFYRIDNAGKGKIEPASIVTVAVKESLTNGKVIKDMNAAGTSITQPLNSYPPMFKSAIVRLQNHGSMTMVVPPNLAYGDKGLPPDIPPASTMVYELKVLDLPAPGSSVTP